MECKRGKILSFAQKLMQDDDFMNMENVRCKFAKVPKERFPHLSSSYLSIDTRRVCYTIIKTTIS